LCQFAGFADRDVIWPRRPDAGHFDDLRSQSHRLAAPPDIGHHVADLAERDAFGDYLLVRESSSTKTLASGC
jgi:hypothetical protein